MVVDAALLNVGIALFAAGYLLRTLLLIALALVAVCTRDKDRRRVSTTIVRLLLNNRTDIPDDGDPVEPPTESATSRRRLRSFWPGQPRHPRAKGP